MDIDAAIQAHVNWKIKLTQFMNGSAKEKIDANVAGKDDACALGQWLHGEGRTVLAGRSDYQDLVSAHAEFHRQVAALVRKCEAGQTAAAHKELDDASSAYRRASVKVIGLLMGVKSVLGAHATAGR
jgi:hypothetical protein